MKKKCMNRKLFVRVIFLVLILSIGVLTGCGQGTSKPSDNASSTSGQSGSQTVTSAEKTGGTTKGTESTLPPESQKAIKPQAPVTPEKNPPGDIPDNQAFIPYISSDGHYQITVPEGWAQSGSKTGASFSDKLNTITINQELSAAAPTVESARSTEVPILTRIEPAFQLQNIKQVTLPGGPALLIAYRVNSAPNQVTGKQYRLDVLRYEFFKDGTKVSLILSSPVGADNVDPWNVVSRSFKWLP